jgi:hypothetical protein
MESDMHCADCSQPISACVCSKRYAVEGDFWIRKRPSSPVEAASEAPSQPQASERELPPLQGGMSNDELRAALRAKLPAGAYPEDQWLTPFALGVEVGAARAQEPDQDEPSADARDA